MIDRYPLLNEANRTMCVFEKDGKFYGHILKDATEKVPAKIVFETVKFDSLEAFKLEYPPALSP
ncbi:hypothetical protein G9U52_15775 [Paenibacillus sp. S3N08]|uniref:Uncharacterized protein n=1 Tax=Paenibacillus agricola TaxID=2716264 RepID=A0ABX0J4J6_9BACL|nr:hypothetical protein [Paenibacillus agricola]